MMLHNDDNILGLVHISTGHSSANPCCISIQYICCSIKSSPHHTIFNLNEVILNLKKSRGPQFKKKKPKTNGVVYLGHIPHGFYENEIRQFFTQFGQVKRVKVSRSPKVNNILKILAYDH